MSGSETARNSGSGSEVDVKGDLELPEQGVPVRASLVIPSESSAAPSRLSERDGRHTGEPMASWPSHRGQASHDRPAEPAPYRPYRSCIFGSAGSIGRM